MKAIAGMIASDVWILAAPSSSFHDFHAPHTTLLHNCTWRLIRPATWAVARLGRSFQSLLCCLYDMQRFWDIPALLCGRKSRKHDLRTCSTLQRTCSRAPGRFPRAEGRFFSHGHLHRLSVLHRDCRSFLPCAVPKKYLGDIAESGCFVDYGCRDSPSLLSWACRS